MYQTPIFKELEGVINKNNLQINCKVLFGDDLSLKNTYNKDFEATYSYGKWLLKGYKYKFLKNYSRDSRSGFLSRVNPGIVRELTRERCDVVLIHGYESLTAWFAVLTAKYAGIKIIWRGEAVLRGVESRFSFKQILKRTILNFFFKSCDALMYSCSGNKEYLQFYKVDDNKLFSIPCAVDNAFFTEQNFFYSTDMDNLKNDLKINKENMVIIFAARFTKRKRPLDLLRSLINIDYSKITILFVGDGPERKSMESFAKKHNISAIFTGFQSQLEISSYYKISDLDIVISDYDPSPKALNEAMNFELPAIVTNVVGTAYDLIKEGKNGYIVNVGDCKEISEKIDYLNNNRLELKKMGKESYNIIQKWNYQEDVKGILKAVNHVVNDRI
jgi:glycosyltransferase involved in cell wall biosynthesis